MAKTSLKVKQQRKPKYSTRAYTRCRICGRPHSCLLYTSKRNCIKSGQTNDCENNAADDPEVRAKDTGNKRCV